MVCEGKSNSNGWFRVARILGNPHVKDLIQNLMRFLLIIRLLFFGDIIDIYEISISIAVSVWDVYFWLFPLLQGHRRYVNSIRCVSRILCPLMVEWSSMTFFGAFFLNGGSQSQPRGLGFKTHSWSSILGWVGGYSWFTFLNLHSTAINWK